MDETLNRRKQKSVRHPYKYRLIIIIFILIICLIINKIFSRTFMNLSIELTLYLKPLPLKQASLFFSYFVYFLLWAIVGLLYIFQRNTKNNIMMLFGSFSLMYFQALFKLLLVDGRPTFYSDKLPSEDCICDYGNPSGHALCTTGLLLFIYQNLKNNWEISKSMQRFLKFIFILIGICMGFSRLYLSAHSFNQIIIGAIIGRGVFIFTTNYYDTIRMFFIEPLFKKDKLRLNNFPAKILVLFVLTNYILLMLGSYRHIYFETNKNQFFEFSNCFECLASNSRGFTEKIVIEGLLFNIGFGILLGIYLWRDKKYPFKGLFYDKNKKLAFCRILILTAICSLLIFVKHPTSESLLLNGLRSITIPIIVGFFISNVLLRVTMMIIDPDEIQVINDRILDQNLCASL